MFSYKETAVQWTGRLCYTRLRIDYNFADKFIYTQQLSWFGIQVVIYDLSFTDTM